jgi:hypothetical protein
MRSFSEQGRSFITVDIAILFDWFTYESIDAALQAADWKDREVFLEVGANVGDGCRTSPRRGASDATHNTGYLSIVELRLTRSGGRTGHRYFSNSRSRRDGRNCV